MSGTSREEALRLQRLVDARSQTFRDRLPPRLRAAFDDLASRLGLGRVREGEAFVSYFVAPLALPVLQLPAWACRVAALEGTPLPDESEDDLIEAAATGYLHVRVQDDLIDEGTGRPAEAMLLAEALFVRHQSLIARVVGASEGFWRLFEERWLEYDDAMILERELMDRREGYDAAAFEQVLRRTQPLVLPGAAALVRGGLADRVPILEEHVAHLARAHQLFHDLIDADKDFRMGNHTHVVQRCRGAEGREALIRNLMLEGGFDEITDEALAALEKAESAAARLPMPDAVDAIRRRRQLMEQTRREAFESLFRGHVIPY
jgi:hypothetical protein